MEKREIRHTAVSLAHNIVGWLEPLRLKGADLRELNMIMGVGFALAAEDLKFVYKSLAERRSADYEPKRRKFPR